MPWTPYALSLALSVFYRQMRHSSLPMYREGARDSFDKTLEMLGGLGDWTRAKHTYEQGQAVVKMLDNAGKRSKQRNSMQPQSHPPLLSPPREDRTDQRDHGTSGVAGANQGRLARASSILTMDANGTSQHADTGWSSQEGLVPAWVPAPNESLLAGLNEFDFTGHEINDANLLLADQFFSDTLGMSSLQGWHPLLGSLPWQSDDSIRWSVT
jgi:hypothetical protein